MPLPYDILLAFLRSRLRVRVLFLVEQSGSLAVPELIHLARIDHTRLGWVLRGDPSPVRGERAYSPERALLALGLVRVVSSRAGDVVEITEEGRAVAAQLRMRVGPLVQVPGYLHW